MVALNARRVLVDGEARGPVVTLSEPLSFWGGLEPGTGRIIDQHHPDLGRSLAGVVLVMTSGRGSSSGSSVLAEAVRAGVGPAAIVMARVDEIVALGGIVADELYGIRIPILVVDPENYARLGASSRAEIRPGGVITSER